MPLAGEPQADEAVRTALATRAPTYPVGLTDHSSFALRSCTAGPSRPVGRTDPIVGLTGRLGDIPWG
jgi:hypothetical protein